MRFDSVCRERIETVGDRSGTLGEEFGQTRIVRAEDQPTARLFGEGMKLAADGFQVGIKIEMLGVHVQHDGVVGMELTQGAVAFVGFDDEPGLRPRGRMRTGGKV